MGEGKRTILEQLVDYHFQLSGLTNPDAQFHVDVMREIEQLNVEFAELKERHSKLDIAWAAQAEELSEARKKIEWLELDKRQTVAELEKWKSMVFDSDQKNLKLQEELENANVEIKTLIDSDMEIAAQCCVALDGEGLFAGERGPECMALNRVALLRDQIGRWRRFSNSATPEEAGKVLDDFNVKLEVAENMIEDWKARYGILRGTLTKTQTIAAKATDASKELSDGFSVYLRIAEMMAAKLGENRRCPQDSGVLCDTQEMCVSCWIEFFKMQVLEEQKKEQSQ